jgi:hypothetical protein
MRSQRKLHEEPTALITALALSGKYACGSVSARPARLPRDRVDLATSSQLHLRAGREKRAKVLLMTS